MSRTRIPGSSIKQGRKDDQEDKVGIKGDVWNAGNTA